MVEKWREHLQQLSAELESKFSAFHELEKQHQQLLESWTLGGLHQPVEHEHGTVPPLPGSDLPLHDVTPVTMSAPLVRRPCSDPGPGMSVEQVERPQVVTNQIVYSQEVQRLVAEDKLPPIQPWKKMISPTPSPGDNLNAKLKPQKSWSLAITAALPVVPEPSEPKPNLRANVDDRPAKGVQFTLMRAQRTRHFSFGKPWYVINPEGTLGAVWQIIMAVCLAFVAVITPVQVGLLPLTVDFLLVFSLCIDALFLIDTIMQFLTMYKVKTARGFVWEPRLKMIAWHYVTGWFAIDALALIPFDLVSLASQTENRINNLKGLKALRALRLLKLMRVLKSSSIMHKIEISLAMPYHHLALFRFLAFLLFYCHWLACIWAMCLQLVDPKFPQWIDEIERSDALFGIVTRDSAWRVYVTAFYFCSYTLTSVGYGDLGPKNILERAFCTGMVLTAGICWAYILGQVCAIVTDITEESIAWRKKMFQLNSLTQEHRLPNSLGTRLRSYFVQNRTLSLFMTQQKLLQDMSPQLQAEVCTELNLRWMNKVPFFRDFSLHIASLEEQEIHTLQHRLCIADISRQLKCTAFAQAESFETEHLYILSRGLVALNHRVGFDGAVWGEDFVLHDKRLIRPVSCYALTYIEVLFLTRESFLEVIEHRRHNVPELAQIVRRYCVRMAVRRGVMAEARRRIRLKNEMAEEDSARSMDTLRESPKVS